MSDSSPEADLPALSPGWRRALIVCSCLALIWAIAARVAGPSDLWDQTQPKTVSYTTDIVANGRWILPIERGKFPATKPPLYNWLAAPAVAALGFDNEIAHKLPSITALCLCWVLLVRLGQSFDRNNHGVLGWLAGMAFVSGYTIFKLGYLARPDMVLTLWLLLGWWAATLLFIKVRRGEQTGARRLALVFWLCVTLAGLTKGPPALALVVFVFPGARIIAGRWRAVGRLGWWWGLPLSLLVVGAWLVGVWIVDPTHLREELWFNEIYGRVTGLGPEGNLRGPIGWLTDLPNIALYYFVRFAPWSLLSVIAMVDLLRRARGNPEVRRWRVSSEAGAWMISSILFIICVVTLFTLSTGKRADYIAATFGPGSLLAAWWFMRVNPFAGIRLPWLAPLTAAICLIALTINNQQEVPAPHRGFGDAMMAFAHEARVPIAAEPAPVAFYHVGTNHLQAMLGFSEVDGPAAVTSCLDAANSCWVVAGVPKSDMILPDWLAVRHSDTEPIAKVVSAELPRQGQWPEQVTLYRVTR